MFILMIEDIEVDMFCQQCGKQIDDRAIFCSFCGYKNTGQDTAREGGTQETRTPGRRFTPRDMYVDRDAISDRAKILLAVQFIMLVLSPVTGGFKFTTYSMLDTGILLIGICVTTMVFVDFDEGRQKIWLFGGAIAFFVAMIVLVINLFSTPKWF
jgi:hypothetical protein